MAGIVLLTGATGFVGRQVLQALIHRGVSVRLVVRHGQQSQFTECDEIESVITTEDLFTESVDWWAQACLGIDSIIHVAWYADPGKYLESTNNLDCLIGTLIMAKGAVTAGVRRFIGIGTCFEYELTGGTLSVDTPLKPLTPYAAAKAAAFMALSQWLPHQRVEFTWCRLFYLYGEGEDARRLVPYLRSKLEAKEPADLTSGHQIRDFLDVQEAARLIVQVALNREQGPVNVCSGRPVTVRQLAEQIADEYGGRHLLRFGARPDNLIDPPCVVGIRKGNGMDESNRVLYRQERLPIFQNRMYDTSESAKSCPKGDIELIEDLRTGLTYNRVFRPELMVYDAHYQNEQATSPLFQTHLESVSYVVGRCLGRERIVEVGCGKGYFLELLQNKGFEVTGFDPTYEGDNPVVKRHYFEPGVGIQAQGLILRHVLEHVQDPFVFLRGLKEANGGSGLIYIEVPCFDWICEHRAWFDIFYEHVNYFRVRDFYRMFSNVIESGKLFGGQYLYVVAELSSLRPPLYDGDDPVCFPSDFAKDLEVSADNKEGKKKVIWGGASKGVIFALLKARANQPVDAVIDINPSKQGKYLPGTGHLVQAPNEVLPALPGASTIYVMNSNYLAEIIQMSGNKFDYIGIDNE